MQTFGARPQGLPTPIGEDPGGGARRGISCCHQKGKRPETAGCGIMWRGRRGMGRPGFVGICSGAFFLVFTASVAATPAVRLGANNSFFFVRHSKAGSSSGPPLGDGSPPPPIKRRFPQVTISGSGGLAIGGGGGKRLHLDISWLPPPSRLGFANQKLPHPTMALPLEPPHRDLRPGGPTASAPGLASSFRPNKNTNPGTQGPRV